MDETPILYQVFWRLIVEFLRYHKKTYLLIVTAVWVVTLVGAAAFLAWGISFASVWVLSFSYETMWVRLWPFLSALFVVLGIVFEVRTIQRVRQIIR